MGTRVIARGATRRLIAALLAALLVAVAVGVTPAAAAGRTVLLVHGFRGSPSSFDQMKASLEARGIEAIAVALPGQDNVANANYLQGVVQQIVQSGGPGTTVDVVAHSMGGLSSRWYAKFLGGSPGSGSAVIAHYISLGSPQYGVWSACLLPQTYGGQMCPSSSFLRQLNTGDDTPGAAAYTTIYSTSDGYVPTSSSRLDGGACFVQDSNVTHSGLLTDATVFGQIVQALAGTCPGTFKTN